MNFFFLPKCFFYLDGQWSIFGTGYCAYNNNTLNHTTNQYIDIEVPFCQEICQNIHNCVGFSYFVIHDLPNVCDIHIFFEPVNSVVHNETLDINSRVLCYSYDFVSLSNHFFLCVCVCVYSFVRA